MREQTDVRFLELTTLRLGGPAKRLVIAETEREVVEAVRAADAEGEPLLVLGGGSNLVVGDAGFAGLVITLAMPDVTIAWHGDEALVSAGAGAPWDDLVAQVIDAGLAGVECMSGIPVPCENSPIRIPSSTTGRSKNVVNPSRRSLRNAP